MNRNSWPAFAVLAIASIATAQNPAAPAPSTDVYAVRLTPQIGVLNITNRAGYDNQPAWVGRPGEAIYYTAQVGGQTDIHQLNFETSAIGPVVRTPESEYSAAPTPDGQGYTVVRVELDSTQRLWRFPLRGRGEPEVVLPDIKPVGYFAYLDSTTLALFVLGSPNTLQIADARTGRSVVVTTNIGRSIQHVPGARKASFTQRIGGQTTILIVDATPRADGSFTIDTIATLPDSAEYVVWKSPTHVITGAGSRLLQLRLPSRDWEVLADLSARGIRRISRLALSPRGDVIAVVADEPRP